MFHLANLLSVILKVKSVALFKKNYSPFCLIYVVFFTLSLFKCHYFIFNFQFDSNMNISKRRVNFQEKLKSELVVKTLCSFLVHTCQMSKSFVALQKSLSCPVFKFIPNGHFNDRSQNFQTNRGGGVFTTNLNEIFLL